MISKAEYAYLKVKRDKLKESIRIRTEQWEASKKEKNNPELSPQQRYAHQKAWDEYYEAVRKGYRAQCFFALRKLVVDGQGGNLKAHINDMMADPRWNENVKEPDFPEPSQNTYEENGIGMDISRLNQLEKQIEEYATVYGGKKDTFDL